MIFFLTSFHVKIRGDFIYHLFLYSDFLISPYYFCSQQCSMGCCVLIPSQSPSAVVIFIHALYAGHFENWMNSVNL